MRKGRGFTLIELLVVIAVSGLSEQSQTAHPGVDCVCNRTR
ncbi:MAG: type II secretion system protein [Planctomycetota bacterium]